MSHTPKGDNPPKKLPLPFPRVSFLSLSSFFNPGVVFHSLFMAAIGSKTEKSKTGQNRSFSGPSERDFETWSKPVIFR
jgi:hypothetical protein